MKDQAPTSKDALTTEAVARRLEKFVSDRKRDGLRHLPVLFPLLLTKPFRNGWRSWVGASRE